MSIPCGFVRGLPVGLQIVGPHFAEAKLLNVRASLPEGDGLARRIPAAFTAEKLS